MNVDLLYYLCYNKTMSENAPRFIDRIETNESPQEQLEKFLATYAEIMKILTWLIEASQNFPPLAKAIKRQKLANLLASLGLDADDPDAILLLQECYNDTMARARNPQPALDIPSVEYFESRIGTITRNRSTANEDAPFMYRPTLSDIAEYGWTNWASVQSRNPSLVSTPQYIRDVAKLIADPTAYTLTFRRHDDDMEVTPTWEVANGRHRSLAAAVLGPNVLREAGVDSWVRILEVPY